MTKIGTTRRGFMARSAVLGLAGLMPAMPHMVRAQEGKVLRVRQDGDNAILDPAI